LALGDVFDVRRFHTSERICAAECRQRQNGGRPSARRDTVSAALLAVLFSSALPSFFPVP
jgi:predicted patatin/cPLA2 family phospholipase